MDDDNPTEKKQTSLMIGVDYEKYAKLLEDTDLSEAEKHEFLETLWSVIVSFVDLGFQVHPIQDVCESELVKAFEKAGGPKNGLPQTSLAPKKPSTLPDKGVGRSPL